jgi:hypothetical protein
MRKVLDNRKLADVLVMSIGATGGTLISPTITFQGVTLPRTDLFATLSSLGFGGELNRDLREAVYALHN